MKIFNVKSFVNGTVYSVCFSDFDMSFCSVEVGISRNDVTVLYQNRKKHILGRPSLVGWEQILESGDFVHRIVKFLKRAGACVTLITHHQSTPLTVTHCSGSGIR